MKLLVTKTCQGVVDTDKERKRIKKAFRNDPETRQQLTLLMDAIEAGEWEKADKMLEGQWWNGRDKRQECPRLEFVGMLDMANPEQPGHPAHGWDHWAGYIDLVYVMSRKRDPGETKYTISTLGEQSSSPS